MSLQLLGPLTAQAGGRMINLGPRKQRLVLAVLALEVNRPVEVTRLVDLAWPMGAPRTAAHAVRVGVSALRSAFAGVPGLQIRTQGSGYALVTDPMNIDVHRFRSLLAQARSTSDDTFRVALLDRALGLWAGEALAGAAPPETQQRLFVGLDEARLGAQEDLLDARLRLGHHHELAGELAVLAAAHPLRERLAGQLMLALYRDGRSGDSLSVFQQHREHLAAELGLDAGVALRQLELAILRNDQALLALRASAPSGPVPAQLPPAAAGFAGRTQALSELDALVVPRPAGGIAVITGTAGVGKTALAVHWAHRHRGAFPDGQLHVNLAGYAPGAPMPPHRALTGFLRALGVPAERIPLEIAEAATLYRSLLADRRILVVLDNAAGPEQVRPLLPGGPGCLTVITSRDRLEGLVVREGARTVPLGVLPADEAHALLAGLLGARRIGADPAAAAELARLCAYLPLALRIAAAHLARHLHQPVAELAARLREGNRLAILSVAGDQQSAVRGAFDLSYATLAPAARRLFRLIGLNPGADISVPAAAALAAIGTGQAGALLAELATAHLVDEDVPGRFAVHDLLRLYAADRAAQQVRKAARRAASARLCDFYLQHADAAARLVYPSMQRLPLPTPPATRAGEGTEFADPAAALAWLETERPNLVATITTAAASGPQQAAWLLADALRGFFWMRRYAGDWLAVAEAGLAAARTGQEPRAEAAAHLSLAQAMHWLARYPAAIEHLTQARALAQQAGWRQGEAAALGTLGNVYRDQGQMTESAGHHRQAYDIYRQTGGLGGQATSLGNLGNLLMDLGRLPEAIDCMTRALAIYREVGALHAAGHRVLDNLGCAYLIQGQMTQARDHLEQALAQHRQVGSRDGEGEVLNDLAELHRDAGDYQLASQLAQDGLALARESGDQRLELQANSTLGSLCRLRDDLAGALGHYQVALQLAIEGYRFGEPVALIGLAETRASLGRYAEARSAVQQALFITRQTGLRVLEGRALTALAAIALGSGYPAEAVTTAREALAVHRETGCRLGETRTLRTLAEATDGHGKTGDGRA